MKIPGSLFMIPIWILTACSTRIPTQNELLEALYTSRPLPASPCSRVLTERLYAASSLAILKSHCRENQCLFEVEVTTPELPERAIREAMKIALLEAIQGIGEGESLSERACNVLARHLKDLEFKSFKRKRLLLRVRRAGKNWKIIAISKREEDT